MMAQLSPRTPRGSPAVSIVGVRWAGYFAMYSGPVDTPHTSCSSKSRPAARTKMRTERLLTLGLRMFSVMSAIARAYARTTDRVSSQSHRGSAQSPGAAGGAATATSSAASAGSRREHPSPPRAHLRCPRDRQTIPGGAVHEPPEDLREALIANGTALEA